MLNNLLISLSCLNGLVMWLKIDRKQLMICHNLIQDYLNSINQSCQPVSLRNQKLAACICRRGGAKWRGDEWGEDGARIGPWSLVNSSRKATCPTPTSKTIWRRERWLWGWKGSEEESKDSDGVKLKELQSCKMWQIWKIYTCVEILGGWGINV